MSSKDKRHEEVAELRRQTEEIAREKAVQSPENLEVHSPEETRQMLHELRVHQIELEMQNEELRRTHLEVSAARDEDAPVCSQRNMHKNNRSRKKVSRNLMKLKLKHILCAFLLGIASNIAADELAVERKSLNGSSAKSSDTLVITLRNDFPPLSFLNVEGHPAGLFVDMWRLWAEKTGRKIEFHSAAFRDTLGSFKKGTADIHGALNYSEERSEWIAFSQPIYELSFCFFFSKKHGKVLNISELNGQKIGVTGGTYLEEQLHKRYPDIKVVPFAAIEDTIRAALDGKILAFLSTPASTSVMLRQMGLAVEFESSDEKFFTRRLYAGVLKDNKELLSLVDKGFDQISNEELAEIEQRWVPDPDKRYYRTPTYSSLKERQRKVLIRLTAAEEAWIRAHNTVNISVPAVFPPVMFLAEDKSFQGMVQDYLDLFSKRTGMRFDSVYAPLSELYELIQTRRTDMYPAFMGLEPNLFMDLTDSCFTLSWVIVNRIEAPFLRDVKGLKGMKVAIVKNIPIYEQLRKNHPEIEIFPADNPVDAMKSVSSGNADAFVGAFIVSGYVMQKYQVGNLKIAGQTEYEDFLFKFAVRNDWPELVSILNKAIASITPQEHDQIFYKWMPVRYEYAVQWQTIIKWVLWVGGVLGMISGLMLFWNRKLAKEILQRKTVESALRVSEEQFRLVFEQSHDAFFWADPETGIIINCNAKAEEITERTREELIGMHQSRLHPSERDCAEAFRQAVTAHATPNIDAEVISRTGKRTPVLISTTVVALGSRRIAQGIFHDITERKRTEEVQAFLAQTSTGTQDETFFEALARYLAKNLGMDFVCIDRLEGDGLTARTVVVWCDGKFEDNVTYALKDTPCGEVVGKLVCCFPASVCQFFPLDQILQDLRAESYVGVTLFDHTGRPIGLIAVIGRSPLENRPLAEAALKMVAVRAAGELERLDAEAALRASLAEKEVLLKEVHHRVKNNLAAIRGLVDMQGQKLNDEPVKAALTELSARIRSMALVHEQLYQSEDFSRIDFQDYLEALIAHLRSSYEQSGDIHVSVAAVGVEMGLDSAVPCGLLITELVTNVLKYAFPAGRPRPGTDGCEIAVSAEWDGAAYTLTVADNGVGLPADLDWTNTKTLGLLLVKMLGQHQLQGRIELDRTGGTTFRLRFAPKDTHKR